MFVLLGAGALGLLGSGVSCLIPDHDIQVLSTDVNRSPVRFVEGIPLTEEASCACSNACECPMALLTSFPPLLDPADSAYQFCICGQNKNDTKRLNAVTLYVEDQDEVDGEADDIIRAAALLDWDPTIGDPTGDYVAYRNYLDPEEPLNLVISTYEAAVIKRPRPYVREIGLSDIDGFFDLCNGAGRPVGPGLHTLSIIVTDRPWFKREGASNDGGESMAVTQQGVPDIAAGATFDIQTSVFQCLEEGDDNCDCADIAEP